MNGANFITRFTCSTVKKRHLFITSMAADILEIDGSLLEGGGQILRVATSLSCLTGRPIKLFNIRAGRSTGGLRPQHLMGIQLVRDLCQGQLDRAQVGSTEVTFWPGKLKAGRFVADTKTAGSVCLLLQVALPCMLFADGEVSLQLKGGTNADFAPQIDYFEMVFQPMAERMGIGYTGSIKRRGYYPKGGGEVKIVTSPVKPHLQPITLLDRGQVTRITGKAFVAGVLPTKMAHAMAQAASQLIKARYKNVEVHIEAYHEQKEAAFGNGSGINIVAETTTGCRFGGSALGKRGVEAHEVGQEAAQQLLSNLKHGGCVDEHLQDQLIIFMALAKGKSLVRSGPITLHTKTAIFVTELLLKDKVKFNITQDGETNIVECEGVGL